MEKKKALKWNNERPETGEANHDSKKPHSNAIKSWTDQYN